MKIKNRFVFVGAVVVVVMLLLRAYILLWILSIFFCEGTVLSAPKLKDSMRCFFETLLLMHTDCIVFGGQKSFQKW